MAYRGYKYRLYPDSEARAFFARCFGATRYIYNYCVRQYDAATAEGREVSGFDIMALAREHMNTLAWLSDVDCEIKEFAPMRFDKALSKYKRYQANRPREHKKGEQSYVSYTTGGVIKVDFKHDLVQLPKIGIVKARLHRPFSGEITTATIKREADGNYYISFTVKSESSESAASLKPHTEAGTIGIDVGLRHLATLSNGDTIDLPDMERDVKRIQFLKKRLDRQVPGSQRYYRTKLQIARLHHHLANVSKDAHHKAAASLCRDYDTICMETLNVEGMKLGEARKKTSSDNAFNAELHRAALSLFVDRVKQKAADTGTNFVSIDRWEPTTKTCNHCGYVLPTIDLDTKEWTCPDCGTHHDRDHNAAINIRRKGLEQIAAQPPKETLPLAEGNVKPAKKATACCDLRTGKGKAKVSRPPKAQIADGSAPPRIFKREPKVPREPRYEMPTELKYFKLSPLAMKANTTTARLIKWMQQLTYGEIPEDMESLHQRILSAISQVSDELRHTEVKQDSKGSCYEVLGRMNKVARVDWLIGEVIPVEPTFTSWRGKMRTPEEMQIIKRVVTVDFTARLDTLVKRLKDNIFETEEPKKNENTNIVKDFGG